jgi:hypothetical protein
MFFIILERIFEACGITHQHWHNEECHDDHQGAIKHHNHPKKIYNEDYNPENMDKSGKFPDIGTNNIIA